MRMGQKFLVRDEMEYTLEENISINKVLRSITWGLHRNCSISAMWIMLVSVQMSHVIFLFPDSHLHPMESGNNTEISEFLLLGLSEEQELLPLIFGFFLSMYLITVFGNLLIILAISSDYHLHTPMYFFLSNLSFVDICFTSTTIPKMLWNIQNNNKGITYEGCITQMYFYILFGGLDDILLSVMAYDRYVAICHPLNYTVIMSPQLCGLLVLISWVLVALNSLLHSLMVLRLSFCPEIQIPHFFCELSQVVQLASSDNFLNNIVMHFAAVMMGVGPFTGIFYSYS